MRKLKRLLALLLVAAYCLAVLPARTEALAPAPRYPVIFIPGIGGTELHTDKEIVWINTLRLAAAQIPIINLFHMNWLLPLRLTADGVTPYYASGKSIRTGDILRHGLTDIYGDMIESLRRQGYTEGKDLFVFPFDWRQDLTTAADRLAPLVDQVRRESGADKVVLIGHSMGGLIARDYVVRGGAPKVKATISLATPYLGSPMAYRAVQYGWDMGMKIPGTRWSALAPKDVQLLTKNYLSVYQLAPGHHYFDLYPEGYLTRSGANLGHADALEKGMAPHNRDLARRGATYQDKLLDGHDYGVAQFVLAGKGRQTVSGFTERTDWLGIKQRTERHTDGDEVVPLSSADLGYSQNPASVTKYLGQVRAVAYAEAQHTFITQSKAVQAQVAEWLDTLK